MFSLTEKATVYVPSAGANGQPLAEKKRQDVLDYVLTQFSSQYGGATAQDAIGAWVNDAGTLVREDVTLVFAFAQRVVLNDVVKLAEYVKKALSQESVGFEVQGAFYLV